MNILFTCAGRRNYLIEYFKRSLQGAGKVLVADMQNTNPTAAVADKSFIVSSIYADGYIDELIKICIDEDVKAIISLFDSEIPLLAANEKKFHNNGTKLIIPSSDIITTCFDKYETFLFAKRHNFNPPLTFIDFKDAKQAILTKVLDFPLVIKPRWGMASIGVEIVRNFRELELAL